MPKRAKIKHRSRCLVCGWKLPFHSENCYYTINKKPKLNNLKLVVDNTDAKEKENA